MLVMKYSKDYKKMINSLSLYQVAKNVFAVKTKDDYLLAMLFMRYQEYYESTNSSFRNNHFLVEDYIEWYTKSFKKTEKFTYAEDWSGFNVPSKVLIECYGGIRDLNQYDVIMGSIIRTIRKKTNKDFYLIGTETNNFALTHELAHGFFYTNKKYRKKALKIVREIRPETYEKITKALSDKGYTENVFDDEIQAYLATATNLGVLMYKFGLSRTPMARRRFFRHSEDLSKLFKKYHKNKEKEIKIDFLRLIYKK